MKGSREKAVAWPYTNRETFFRFGSFAHTGDYKVTDSLRETDICQAHAQMYIFADYHGVDELKKRSLECLDGALYDIGRKMHSTRRFHPVVEFVAYIYEETRDVLSEKDPLSCLIVDFCAKWSDHLIEVYNFQRLLCRVPELLVPLIKKLGKMGPLEAQPVVEVRDRFDYFVAERSSSENEDEYIEW